MLSDYSRRGEVNLQNHDKTSKQNTYTVLISRTKSNCIPQYCLLDIIFSYQNVSSVKYAPGRKNINEF